MIYIQQSLNADEEIICIGHFHWFYTFNASIWLVFGLLGMFGVLYGGYYFEVYQYMNNHFAGLPHEMRGMAWDDSAKRLGGMVNIILSQHIIVKLGAFFVFMLGLLSFVQLMMIKATTEICLTSDRLVLKRGLISRLTEEISVDRIEGVDVFQGIFGRIFGYGNVSVRGMGVGEISLPPIADPVHFRKSIEQARGIRRTSGRDI